MKKVSAKNYLIAFLLYLVAFLVQRYGTEPGTMWYLLTSVVLFAAIINFGYQLYRYYAQHDEFVQRKLMEGVCFGALLTGVICLFYSFLNHAPVFQAEWSFYMLVLFSSLGQAFFTHKAS